MRQTPRFAPSPEPDVAAVAALIGDPVRAAILFALVGGTELSASELAFRAAATPQAASAHLAKLRNGGLILTRPRGRQRLFRLASREVACAIESLATIARPATVRALSQNATLQRLREARSCYDHLAGRLGVAVADELLSRELLRSGNDELSLTRSGVTFFTSLDIDVDRLRAERRSFSRPCIDWTERRPHLAGALGASLLDRFLRARWLERNPRDRALRVTNSGKTQFAKIFHVRFESHDRS